MAGLADRYKVPARALDDVLADPAVDGVVIAAPAISHAELASKALTAGKHVYVEKPLALDLADADKLIASAAAKDRVLMVGHLLRYHPAFIKLAELVGTGELGRVQYVHSTRLHLGRFRTEENSLWSFAPHDISMILALLGEEPEKVMATGHCFLNRNTADVTTTHLYFPSGRAAQIHVSWLYPFKEQRLVVVGEHGMAVFNDGNSWADKLVVYPHRVDWRDGVPVPNKAVANPVPVAESEPLRAECEHFLSCIAEGRPALTDGHEGLRVLKVLDAAQRSMNQGRVVSFADEKTEKPAPFFRHATAAIDDGARVGKGTKIWHYSHVLSGAVIGEGCVIGQNVMVGAGAVVGNACKIQNNVSVYDSVTLEDGVFCGPSMVFTNVLNPRAEVERKNAFLPTLVKRGATIGANATIVCGVSIGAYGMIGAGAVVTSDTVPHGLYVGNPAKRIGYVCSCGGLLDRSEWKQTACPECGKQYAAGRDGISELN